ncbi:hypothetical protein ACTXT7_002814 [Hymenolepis weldensis]
MILDKAFSKLSDFTFFPISLGEENIQPPLRFQSVINLAVPPHSVVKMDPHMVRAFCAANEESLRIWCSLLRIILYNFKKFHKMFALCVKIVNDKDEISKQYGLEQEETGLPNNKFLQARLSTYSNINQSFNDFFKIRLRRWGENDANCAHLVKMGPRLLQTYRQRLAACALNYQLSPEDAATGNEDSTLTDGNLAEMVRQKYARESSLYSGAGVRESARQYARLPAVARARSVSQIQAHIANRQGSLSCSQVSLVPADQFRSSVGDLGFVSGRADVGRTLSMNELNAVDQKLAASSTQSLNASQCISSLLNPLRWSRRNIDEAVTPQPMRRIASRKGPAARKCNRSTGNLHRPHSISPSSSVFFLPPANCDASARTSAAVEDDIMTTSQHNLQEPMNQSQTLQIPATPMLINNSGQQQRPGGPLMPHSPRRSGHFAGIRPQLLPSQLSPTGEII